jgi:hypothetical protein
MATIIDQPVAKAPAIGGILIPPTPGIYSFFLDSFQIVNTRSLHTDTDYAGVSLTILQGGDPNRMFQPVVQSKYVGDFNNGTYPVGLAFENVQLADTDVAIFAYHITNTSSGDTSAIGAALESTLQKLITSGVNAALNAIPIVGSILSLAGSILTPDVAKWLTNEIGGIFPGGCDGPVALGAHSLSGAKIKSLLAANSGTYSIKDNNPGVNSSGGCGANSNYNVNLSIK